MDERYTTTTFEPSGELDDRGRGWIQASRLGFAQAPSNEQNMQRWWADAVADGQRWTGLYREAAVSGLGLDHLPVATFATMTHDVNVSGRRLLPSCYILDVSVRTTDRRQGLMREMMVDALQQAHEEGLPLASLTASEATLYGRFGFGIASRVLRVELDTKRFALHQTPTARVEMVDPLAIVDIVSMLHDRHLRSARGAHQPIAMRRDWLSGEWDGQAMAPATDRRAAVAFDEHSEPVGAVTWVVEDGSARVLDLVGEELPLWNLLGHLGLVDKVVFRLLQPTSVLRHALVDPRALDVTGETDLIWLRILDVAKALEARGWDADGEVTLRVSDPMGFTDGCWRVVVEDGRAEVSPSDPEQAQVSLSVRELGEMYLGLTSPVALAGAGRVQGHPDQVRALARLFAVDAPPANLIFF